MKHNSDPRLAKQLSIFTAASAVFSAAVGLAGLAGWKFQITGFVTWGRLL